MKVDRKKSEVDHEKFTRTQENNKGQKIQSQGVMDSEYIRKVGQRGTEKKGTE